MNEKFSLVSVFFADTDSLCRRLRRVAAQSRVNYPTPEVGSPLLLSVSMHVFNWPHVAFLPFLIPDTNISPVLLQSVPSPNLRTFCAISLR